MSDTCLICYDPKCDGDHTPRVHNEDEARSLPDDAYEAIKPRINKGEGKMIIISTPKPKENK